MDLSIELHLVYISCDICGNGAEEMYVVDKGDGTFRIRRTAKCHPAYERESVTLDEMIEFLEEMKSFAATRSSIKLLRKFYNRALRARARLEREKAKTPVQESSATAEPVTLLSTVPAIRFVSLSFYDTTGFLGW